MLTGRLIRETGIVLTASPIVTGLTLAQWLGIFGRLTDTTGYGSARAVLVRLKRTGLEIEIHYQVTSPRLDCGRNYNAVLARYSPLFNLGQIYGNMDLASPTSYNGGQHTGLNIPARLQPDVLSFSAQKLGSDLKSELSCLTNDKLTRCIDTMVDTIVKRLDATKDLIEVSQQLDIVKNNLK